MVVGRGRSHLRKVLFFGSILLILGLGGARLFESPTAAGVTSHSPLVITEFMAADQAVLADEDGQYPDWVELHNRSERNVNLLGWSLTDDPARPNKWMLPNVDLSAGEYLVMFASGKDRPTSVNDPKGAPPPRLGLPLSIHTNFKLAAEGGTLALYDNTSRRFLDSVTFRYPKQYDDMSYGVCDTADQGCYLVSPTPGKPNSAPAIAGLSGASQEAPTVVAPVAASVAHGFYDMPFQVALTTEAPGASIWYTLDGSEPGEGRNQVYGSPLPISSTTTLRAVAVKAGHLIARPATFTYIFPQQVLQQPADPPGYPATWGVYRSDILGFKQGAPIPSDYGMDPDIVQNPKYRDRMEDSLAALPSLSLVTGVEDLDIYFADPLQRGVESERPVSVEWLDPTGATPGFQVDAGLRIHGTHGRSELVPKHSLRLHFKKPYGPTKLEYEVFPDSPVSSFDTLVLRAGVNESYAGHPDAKNRLVTYARDEWLRRSQLATSGFGARGRYVHLYLNGLYWGVYNLVERPDNSFAASYFGGDKETWFSADPSGADEGILNSLNGVRRLAELGDLADPSRYEAMQEYIDPAEFSDYIVLHWYAGALDWPENNWYIAGQSEGRLRFLAWDGEFTWNNGANIQLGVDANRELYYPNIIKRVFNALTVNPDFRMTLADSIYRLTATGSALSDAESRARWMEITGELEHAILAESARWGDTWFEEPISEDDWSQARRGVVDQMTGNTARLISQARAQGYYPTLDPPVFSQQGGNFTGRLSLTISAAGGDIYYTMDGTDPRAQITGAVSPGATQYSGPVDLSDSTRIRARALANGVWSALNEADFVNSEDTANPEKPGGLRITKLMYHPKGGKDYEFLELTNVGSVEVDLSGATLEGLNLRLPYPTRLAGGSSTMLVANSSAFKERYGNAHIAAQYKSSGALADSGETLTLRSASGEALLSLTYDDENGWPLTPDGAGDWLVLTDLVGDMNDPASWRASTGKDQVLGPQDGAGQAQRDGTSEPAGRIAPFDPFAAQPSNISNIRFGDDLVLSGYDTYINGRPSAKEKLPALLPGDVLEYVLYWRGGQLQGKEAYIKLLTPTGELVAQASQALGFHLKPLTDSPNDVLTPDRYTLTIAAGASVGLVQPVLHVYVPDTGVRLPVFSDQGASVGEDYRLPTLKIAPWGNTPRPEHTLHARFGDQIELLGYSLDTPQPDLRPGQSITVTMYFATQAPLEKSFVRSIQLHSPESGMAAQNDAEPAGGTNPTWAWQVGEVVIDTARLEVEPGVTPGSYRLMLTLYDPVDGKRLPIQDEVGNLQPDQILLLRDVTVSQ